MCSLDNGSLHHSGIPVKYHVIPGGRKEDEGIYPSE